MKKNKTIEPYPIDIKTGHNSKYTVGSYMHYV